MSILICKNFQLMEAIDRRETSYYGSVGGNYDGTYIEWFIVEDE